MAMSGSRRKTAFLVALWLVALSSLPTGTNYAAFGNEGDQCMTPQGVTGDCRLLSRCPSLVTLVSQRPSQENLYLLNLLRCGFHGNVPIVCCTDGASEPPESTTNQRPINTIPPSNPFQTNEPVPTRPVSSRPTPTRPTPSRPAPTRPQTNRPRPNPPLRPNPTPTPVADRNSPPDVSQHPNLNLLPQDYCSPQGIDRIVGGKVADVFAYPWIARLGYLSRRSTWKPVAYHCGGSLINSRYVLTAAHCIITKTDLYLATVKLGEHTLDKEIDCRANNRGCIPRPFDVEVEKTEVHPMYDPRDIGSHHDIALARLARDVDFLQEEFVRPVCLPVSRLNQNLKLEGKPLVAAGWGLTEDNVGSNALKDVYVPVMSFEKCKEAFKAPNLQKEIIPQQLCAGGEAGKDSCNGDSGGPLMLEADVNDESKTVLFGIVSFGHSDCGTAGVPGVYTRVAFYVKWILDTMRP